MKQIVFLLLALALAVGLYMMWNSPKPAVEERNGLMTEAQFRDKLAEFRMERDKLERHLKQLEERNQAAITKLKELGITKVADAQQNPEAEMAISSLKSSTELIKDLQPQFEKYDSAISRISGMLDKLDQDRIHSEVKMSEDQEVALRSIIREIDDALGIGTADPLRDAELDALLLEKLGGQ